ncbi:MAG: DUF411 domain-containing protein [Woeseia sp.]
MNSKRVSRSVGKKLVTAPRLLLGVIITAAVVAAAGVWFSIPTSDAKVAEVMVYKTASCGCCNKWVAHLRDNEFEVSVVNVSNTQPTRERLGVPRQLGSCHTAVVGQYWVEGHVPADLIQRLIAEKPDDIRGIAAPGMPVGSPGMEGPNPVEYKVLAYGTDGKTTVYATRQGRSSPQ